MSYLYTDEISPSHSSSRKGILHHGHSKPWAHGLFAITMLTAPHHHSKPIQLGGGGEAVSVAKGEGVVTYLSDEIKQHLENEFKRLCVSKPTLSRAQLSTFLKEVQCESIEPLDLEEYSFKEFLYLWYKSGTILKEATEKDLSRPISNYFISSSHNTYLDGNQLTSNSSTEAYKNVSFQVGWFQETNADFNVKGSPSRMPLY